MVAHTHSRFDARGRRMTAIRSPVSRVTASTSRATLSLIHISHNFLFIGFIARALPNATIVLVKRDPMDTCLSNFRQLFAPGMPRFDYSYDLLDVGRYYLLFEKMVDFWRARLPGRVHEVQYEDLAVSYTHLDVYKRQVS